MSEAQLGCAVRPAEHADLDALCTCVEAGFAARITPARRAGIGVAIADGRSLAAVDGAELVGAIVAHRAELTVPGPVAVPALLLSDAVVAPTHRRRGHLRSLMASAIAGAHERGEAIAVLGASEGGIYSRFGWGPATATASYVLDRATVDVGYFTGTPGRVELLGPDDAGEAFPAVFETARLSRAGEIDRRATAWPELVDSVEDGLSAAMRFRAAFVAGTQIDGYAIYEVRAPVGDRRKVVLEECCALTDDAYTALFAYLCSIDLTHALRTGPRPVDEPFRHVLRDPRALRTVEVCDGAWLRLVDARAALGARLYSAKGRVVVELEDALCPWNEGRWAIESDASGAAEISPSSAAPDLVLGAAALASAYLGGTRVSSLRRAGRVEEREAGSADRLDAMLYCDPVPFCTAL